MAEHKNRNTCGKCGFTEFRHSDESKKQTSKSLSRHFNCLIR